MTLRLGDEAPDFTAETTEGEVDLYDYLGDSWGLLFSHPADFTPVCTTELGEFAKRKGEFDKRNAKLIGLCVDPLESHKEWAPDIADVKGTALNYPLIADPDRKVAELYDMIHPAMNEKVTVRSVFIIGPDKKIKLIITYPQTTGRNIDEMLRVDRLAPAHRRLHGGDAGRLEAGRRRDHRRLGVATRPPRRSSPRAGRPRSRTCAGCRSPASSVRAASRRPAGELGRLRRHPSDSAEVAHRVHGRAVHPHLEVQVRPGGVPGVADRADRLTGGDPCSRRARRGATGGRRASRAHRRGRSRWRCRSPDTEPGDDHRARGRGPHRAAVARADVDPGVHPHLVEDRVHALAERRRDRTVGREPERRRPSTGPPDGRAGCPAIVPDAAALAAAARSNSCAAGARRRRARACTRASSARARSTSCACWARTARDLGLPRCRPRRGRAADGGAAGPQRRARRRARRRGRRAARRAGRWCGRRRARGTPAAASGRGGSRRSANAASTGGAVRPGPPVDVGGGPARPRRASARPGDGSGRPRPRRCGGRRRAAGDRSIAARLLLLQPGELARRAGGRRPRRPPGGSGRSATASMAACSAFDAASKSGPDGARRRAGRDRARGGGRGGGDGRGGRGGRGQRHDERRSPDGDPRAGST